ncbi:hypothetical protein G3O00_33055 [Burkholderia sp. Ac-20384]|uniref:hypothetical protein n=1 Tax=Burkholderia sp. Ac-20384 TaxID=2703902 RepID=UPI00197DC2BE|nr:hypothetical protein [Burkholderia sp. Ac-20384]MBN3828403.1 hypothetical protein [Burkholderia sp. Ac-20384]
MLSDYTLWHPIIGFTKSGPDPAEFLIVYSYRILLSIAIDCFFAALATSCDYCDTQLGRKQPLAPSFLFANHAEFALSRRSHPGKLFLSMFLLCRGLLDDLRLQVLNERRKVVDVGLVPITLPGTQLTLNESEIPFLL